MNSTLDRIKEKALSAFSTSKGLAELQKSRSEFLGKQGEITSLLKGLGKMDPSLRKEAGQKINQVKVELENLFLSQKEKMEQAQEAKALQSEVIDISLSGRKQEPGSFHLLTQVQDEIIDAFSSLGFWVEDGPEIENDYYNFQALNFPDNHPARDMQDSFFVEDGVVLRTHTSPVQIRLMEKQRPPLRMLAPGKVYRNDSDMTHSPVFHQIEGLCVGKDITFSHLKGTLEMFLQKLFGKKVKSRFRPSFFPFTEPSAEVDIEGPNGWMEILGCGMIDPNVFSFVSKKWPEGDNPYDNEKVTGFAFGVGVERVAMLLHGIKDIRTFYENDTRFLKQFK